MKKFLKYIGKMIVLSVIFLTLPISKGQLLAAEELHLIGDGVYFNVFTQETREEEKNGIFKNIDNDSVFYASLQNSGKDRYVTLAGYLNYKSISLEILDENYRQEQIFLEDGANILIPFKLNADIDKNTNYKFLISLFMGSDLHESDTHYQTTQYAISYDYFIQNQSDNSVDLALVNLEPLEYITSEFSGIVLNTDFSTNTDAIKLPPSELVVTQGESFDLAYRIGHISNAQSHLLIVTLGYQQAQINDRDSLLINTPENKVSFGKITLTAPTEKGKYEICALAVPDPETPSPFIPLENTYRFTVTVQ